jgi:hypothetical protein
MSCMLVRRDFLKYLAALPAAGARRGFSTEELLPTVRPITRGPKFHWFGYYDKLQFDPTGRYVLGMEAAFENRTPLPNDVITVGMIDLADHDRWIPFGDTRAWCWQQGCMLQWLPGSRSEVIWNDREGDRFVSHILDVRTHKRRTLPAPVYALSPDGKWALAPDFSRLHDWRPGYGYAGVPDRNANVQIPQDAGIWRISLETGKSSLIVPFAEAAKIPYHRAAWTGASHWFNHLLFSPDATRFSFLHRWGVRQPNGTVPFTTRMFTARSDGTDLYPLDPNGDTSHYIWRDPKHILAWAWHPSHGNKFYLFQDKTDQVKVVGPDIMTVNGHCTYLPGNRWILNDTYPDKQRDQNPYLYEIARGKRVPLGHFRLPPEYAGEWRCDTHPRFSPDGRKVVIDSAHGGNGRQMYLIEIAGIVG